MCEDGVGVVVAVRPRRTCGDGGTAANKSAMHSELVIATWKVQHRFSRWDEVLETQGTVGLLALQEVGAEECSFASTTAALRQCGT
jgi:hypothetical protein